MVCEQEVGDIAMKTVSSNQFCRHAAGYVAEAEQGETLILTRHGKPVATLSPMQENTVKVPAWRQPIARVQLKSGDLSSVILTERDDSP